MPEYIEREAAIKFVKEQMEETNNKTAINGSCVTQTYAMAIRHAVELLRYVPTAYPKADVVEVRRGKWIKTYPDNRLDGDYYCSNCYAGVDIATGEETPIDRELYYCPNCGAKMDGGNNNA